jgi:hypothetical protein
MAQVLALTYCKTLFTRLAWHEDPSSATKQMNLTYLLSNFRFVIKINVYDSLGCSLRRSRHGMREIRRTRQDDRMQAVDILVDMLKGLSQVNSRICSNSTHQGGIRIILSKRRG